MGNNKVGSTRNSSTARSWVTRVRIRRGNDPVPKTRAMVYNWCASVQRGHDTSSRLGMVTATGHASALICTVVANFSLWTFSNTQREGADCVWTCGHCMCSEEILSNSTARRSESGKTLELEHFLYGSYDADSGLRWRVRLAFGIFFRGFACSHNSNRLIGANPIRVGLGEQTLGFEHSLLMGVMVGGFWRG